jgi:hypothetical protein
MLASPTPNACILVCHTLHLEGMIKSPVFGPVDAFSAKALEPAYNGGETQVEKNDEAAHQKCDGQTKDAERIEV